MIDFITLADAGLVDLDKHGVIEASAGTGKTYTLIELVMRALKEQRLSIDQILLVTFTEQATGELKSRIRARILAELNDPDLSIELYDHLKKALQQLNQASVFTIHGFCHRTLNEYAFEQRAVFESQLVNDNELRDQMLHQMKRSWPDDKSLVDQLQTYVGDKRLQNVDDLLLDLAKQYKPGIDVIYPDENAENSTSVMQQFESIKVLDLTALHQEFGALKGLAKNAEEKFWQGIISPFLDRLIEDLKNHSFDGLKLCMEEVYKGKKEILPLFFPRNPAVYKTDHKDSCRDVNSQLAPNFFKLCAELDLMNQIIVRSVDIPKLHFVPKLLKQLNDMVRQHKLSHGLISYDDMITRLWEQLSTEIEQKEQHLTQAIRSKYRLALIDEFQDTDLKQWEIFKQLFLCDSHQLFVIGDPKQAIYSFRGADVNTYRSAVAEIQSLHGGKSYRLIHNYRTAKPLVSALNHFFTRDKQGGWFDGSQVIVELPENTDGYQLPVVLKNPYSIAALSQIHVLHDKADAMKKNLAQQIAQTISHQLINQVEVNWKGKTKYLEPNDICVLVRGKNDAEYIEQALQELNIPFSYHKKQDLYQSVEAIHFQILLTALAEPDRKNRFTNLLISLFFDVKPQNLSVYSENNSSDISVLWAEVKLACSQKDWVKVFDLILHESGVFFRHRHNTRRLANIKQLQQQLLNVALKSKCGAKGLLKTFRGWRENSASEEALHQKDTEQATVNIMTMHISKGLEFPVVFLMGGLSADNKAPRYLKFYDQKQQKTVFDLVSVHQKLYDQQQIDEDQQLFYVAMTRAIFMLFLPQVVGEGEKIDKLSGVYAKTVMPRIKQLNIPIHEVKKDICFEQQQRTHKQSVLSLPDLPEIKQSRSINLYSFSSLSRIKAHRQNAENEFVSTQITESLMADEMTQDGPVESSIEQVPGGVKTGLALHGIFENVSFKAVSMHCDLTALFADDSIMRVVDEQMTLFRLENKPLLNELGEIVSEYRQELAAWVWHTLKKPLSALGGRTLGSVSQTDRCHELSFFWHQANTNLTGFIDLFFVIDGGEFKDYYILDWKSNLSLSGYSPKILADEVMHKHQYNWQYELYALAMQHWFDGLGMEKARLKGALYLFSRGINCSEDEQNGVFFDDFTQGDFQIGEIEADLLAFTEIRTDS